MKIKIATNFIPLLTAFSPPKGVKIKSLNALGTKDLSDISIATGIFIIGTNIASGIIANVLGSWLYDKLKNHKGSANLKIDDRETPINETEIITVITKIVHEKKFNK